MYMYMYIPIYVYIIGEIVPIPYEDVTRGPRMR